MPSEHRGHFGSRYSWAPPTDLVKPSRIYPTLVKLNLQANASLMEVRNPRASRLWRSHVQSRPWLQQLSVHALHRQHTSCSFWSLQTDTYISNCLQQLSFPQRPGMAGTLSAPTGCGPACSTAAQATLLRDRQASGEGRA